MRKNKEKKKKQKEDKKRSGPEKTAVYVWGACGNLSPAVRTPLLTTCSDADEPYTLFPDSPFTMGLTPVTQEPSSSSSSSTSRDNRLLQNLSESFDNSDFSDLTFAIGNKSVHVHSFILGLRSPYLRSQLEGPWKGQTKIDIKEAYDAFYPFLKYLYTDSLEVEPSIALRLLDVASRYGDSGLLQSCQSIVKQSVSIHNVVELLTLANKYDANDMKDFCFNFVLDNLQAVISGPAFSSLPDVVCKELLIKAARLNRLQ